jgi:uncharacterized alkaline shock family protein YloU
MMVVLVIGCLGGLFVLNLFPLADVTNLLSRIYSDLQWRTIIGICVAVVLVLNYIFERVLLSQQQKGRMIAFDNPSGRVSISVDALEDLVKREILSVSEVKEVRSSIMMAGRKGLEIDARLVLNSDVNIPEITANLQEMVKTKIQDTIGVEETIVVKVEVVKIVADSAKKRSKEKDKTPPPSEPAVPFHGYRA